MSSPTSSSEQLSDLSPETEQDNDSGTPGANAFASALARQIEADEDADDSESADDDLNGEPGESRQKGKLENLEAVAKRLGIKVEDLYAVKVPGSGGREALTIGQIKDRFTEFSSLESDRLSITEQRVAQEAEFESVRAELRELLSVVPKEHLSQEKLQAAAQRVAARNKAAGAKLLIAMPEWKDDERRTADVADIVASLSKYGFPASYVATIRDPGLLKFMRDAARREKQVQAALAGVKNVPKKKANAQQQTRGAPRIVTQQQGNGQRPGKPTSDRERFSAALKNAT